MSKLIYKLVFSFSTVDKEERRVEITDSVTLGSTDKTDISIARAGLSTTHGRFSIQNDVLTYTHLSSSGVTTIGHQRCSEKKMYILDVSDVLKIGELNCYILQETPDPPAFAMQEDDLDHDQGLPLERPPSQIKSDKNKSQPQIIDAEPDGQTLSGLEIIQIGEYTANNELIKVEKNRNKKKDTLKRKLRKNAKKKSPLKKDRIDYIKNNQFRKKSYKYGTGMTARVVGDIYNILFFIAVYFYTPIFKLNFLKKLSQLTSQFLMTKKDLVTFIPPEIFNTLTDQKFIIFVIGLLVWNIVSSLLLSLNFGQWIIGLYADGNFVNSRLMGPIRVFISLVTSPLLIFDAPILLNKRSLKEFLTNSQTTTRHSLVTVILSLLVVPALYLFIACHNLFINPSHFSLLLSNPKSDVISLESNLAGTHSNNHIIQSEALGLELKLNPDQKYELITEITNNKQKSNLNFHFYNYQNSETISFNHQQILLRDEVKNIMLKDPLLMFTTPSLYENLVQSESNFLDTIIIRKIFDILTISKSKLLPYFISEGPFLKPVLDLKQLLTQRMSMSDYENIVLIKNGLRYFLTFKIKNKPNEQFFLLTNNKGLSLYTFKSQSGAINEAEVNKVLTEVFASSNILQEKPKVISTAEVFYNLSLNRTISNEESQFLVKSFMELSRKAINTKSKTLTKTILKIFKANEKGLIAINKAKKDKNISELRLALNRIQKALYKREIEFFKLNP